MQRTHHGFWHILTPHETVAIIIIFPQSLIVGFLIDPVSRLRHFIMKQELLQDKESLISWTGLLPTSTNLSTEILVPGACGTRITPGTCWEAQFCSGPVLVKAVQKADLYSRNAASKQNGQHWAGIWASERGWYRTSTPSSLLLFSSQNRIFRRKCLYLKIKFNRHSFRVDLQDYG